MKRCSHRCLTVKTEEDRCSWVVCQTCKRKGPAKHSYLTALIAFAMSTLDGHPRTVTSPWTKPGPQARRRLARVRRRAGRL